jgi:asparagine synthase (glutamine-hydrolysing)
MSGIVGLYYLDNRPADPAALEAMTASLAHRGPDGAGTWSMTSVGLGHRLLWTTPESLLEKQPLSNETGDFILTADARIDNRDELLAALGLSGYLPDQVTDSHLILAAYIKWGESCTEKLLGDFAFAIWDRRKSHLFCARDHFGIKPFFYYRSDQAFAFASEIKALLCLPEVPRRLNEVRISDYLAPMLEDKAITFYQDIWRLPPGHVLTVSPQNIQLRAYWSLDPSGELRLGSDEEYAEAFRELFTEAVRCRLRSAYPVGSMLSGGLDSSSIVCTTRNLLEETGGGRSLHTFSAIFPGLPETDLAKIDERHFVNAVLAKGGLESHYVRADQLSPLADADCLLRYEDEAFVAPNLFMTWGLYQAAHQAGVRVLLDGFGGDSAVSHGNAYLAELAYSGEWRAFFAEINALAQRYNLSPWYYLKSYGLAYLTELARGGRWLTFAREASEVSTYTDISRSNLFLNYGLKRLVPESLHRLWHWRHDRNQFIRDVDLPIHPKFARRIGLKKRLHAFGDGSAAPQTARQAHYLELATGAIPLALEEAGRAAAVLSLESRYPFFDKRLLEFCLSLPPQQKLHQGWSRIILRRAMANILPVQVQWRTDKADLSPNFSQGLLNSNRQVLDAVMLNPADIEAYVDIDALRQVYSRCISKQNGDGESIIWRAVLLALWLHRVNLSV